LPTKERKEDLNMIEIKEKGKKQSPPMPGFAVGII